MKACDLKKMLEHLPESVEVVVAGANDNPVDETMDIDSVLLINCLTEENTCRIVLVTN